MKVRPSIPDNSFFCASACATKVQTATTAPMVRCFSDISPPALCSLLSKFRKRLFCRLFPTAGSSVGLSNTQAHLYVDERCNYTDRANELPLSGGVRRRPPLSPSLGGRDRPGLDNLAKGEAANPQST